MPRRALPALILVAASLPGLAAADELTRIIQQDLTTLGYETGDVDGEATTQTVIAISKFQAENGLDVTGEVTPQLAGVIKASIAQQAQPAAAPAAPAAPAAAAASAVPAASNEAALRAAQQACLQQKVADAQQSQQRKRGFGRLVRAVGRTASELGGSELSGDIARVSSDVYSAGAIASDLQGAAEDLGLTESDVEACRNP